MNVNKNNSEATSQNILETISEMTEEERAVIAKELFATVDRSTRLELTAEGMKELPRGRQSFEVFTQLARIAVVPTYEAAMIRPSKDDESIDILLKQRKSEGSDKDWWEGQWHVPGTVLLASDPYLDEYSDFSIIRNRLIASEMPGVTLSGDVHSLPTVLREGDRGKEVTVRELMLVTADEDMLPETTRFFNIRHVLANPPDGGFVGTHEHFVQSIADKYEHYFRSKDV